MKTILTGVRANEEPTIGNFLGAYMPMINLAKKYAKAAAANTERSSSLEWTLN